MISQVELEKIKEITNEFFDKITFEVEVDFLPQKDLTIPIKVKTDSPQVLIGEGGRTLVEIQHLLKAMSRKKIKEDFYIDLDINGYKEKKIEYLKELAKSIAEDVSLSKKERLLPPMPAYERRVVHLELADRIDVTTESIDREPRRKVIVRPHP